MVEKSNLSILFFTALVLILSFKDIVFIQNGEVQDAASPGVNAQSSQKVVNQPGEDADFNDNSNQFEDDDSLKDNFDDEDAPIKTQQQDVLEEKTIPSLKMKGNVQVLKFKFCVSCGYRNAFEQYSQLIQSKFPDLKIVGENYPTSTLKSYIVQFLSAFKMILIVVIVSGQNPFTYFNVPTPAFYNWAVSNKLYAGMMIFFVSNAIESQLTSTGAFEIYLNDMQIWSKLESDRIPHEKELMQILDVNFNFESDKNAAFGSGNFQGNMKF